MKIIITLLLATLFSLTVCQKEAMSSDETVKSSALDIATSGDQNTPKETQGTSIVFIAGFDEDDNTYYKNAATHFKNQGFFVVEGIYDLDQILQYLNRFQSKSVYNQIHIVSHSNPWRGMSLKTTKEGERITLKTVTNYLNNKQGQHINGITKNTKLIFHSCGLGENVPLLQQLKKVFQGSETPQVFASPFFNVFGGKYAAHYLAKPYYVFYPTGQSKGPLALSQEIARDHPDKNINWREALTTREEPALGEVYSYRFNIPVEWEIMFTKPSEMPNLENPDAIMDFIAEDEAMATTLYEMNIPLEKYRWTVKKNGTTLKILGKTTALCVLEPVINHQDPGNYIPLDISDQKTYTQL